MRMLSHTEIVNRAMAELLRSQFVSVKFGQSEETAKMRNSEHLEFFLDSQSNLNFHVQGGDRVFEYSITFAFQYASMSQKKYESLVMRRIDEMIQLFGKNASYELNGVYAWHHADFEIEEIGFDEENNFAFFLGSVNVYRFCETPQVVYAKYGLTKYGKAVYG